MIDNGYQISGRRLAGEESSASDPVLPLFNLSIVGRKMDSLRHFISDSVDSNAPISDEQIRFVSSEIALAVHDIISNGAALISTACPPMLNLHSIPPKDPDPDPIQPGDDEDGDEIMDIDAAELMADHLHVCEICGKGFKRDANLRMHMRAHGNRFRTPEALFRPETDPPLLSVRAHLFSCPVPGCRRNRAHQKFRHLKSVTCVRSHFKRSHCPKTHICVRCKKSFAVSGELKSHLRSCGERKWRCSCGTSFSRKDKLFGHVALFEGHSPAAVEEEKGGAGFDSEFFDGLMEEIEGFGAII